MPDNNNQRPRRLNPEQVFYILHFTRVFDAVIRLMDEEGYDDEEDEGGNEGTRVFDTAIRLMEFDDYDGEDEDDDEEDGEDEDNDEEDGDLFQLCVNAAVIQSILANEGNVAPAA